MTNLDIIAAATVQVAVNFSPVAAVVLVYVVRQSMRGAR